MIDLIKERAPHLSANSVKIYHSTIQTLCRKLQIECNLYNIENIPTNIILGYVGTKSYSQMKQLFSILLILRSEDKEIGRASCRERV
jgi:hypothetical protein